MSKVYLDFLIFGIKILLKNVNIELLQFGFQHEVVMTHTNQSQCMKGVRLDLLRVVSYEVKDGLKYIFNSLVSTLALEESKLIKP